MKKIIVLVLVILTVVPQIAFAAWWNPLSWFRSQPKRDKTEVLEQRIKELESKINEVPVIVSTPIGIVTTTPVLEAEAKKVPLTKTQIKKKTSTESIPMPKPNSVQVTATPQLGSAESLKKLGNMSLQISYKISELPSFIAEARKLNSRDVYIQRKYNAVTDNLSSDLLVFKKLKSDIDLDINGSQFSSLQIRYDSIMALHTEHIKILKETYRQIENEKQTRENEAIVPIVNTECVNAKKILSGLNAEYTQVNDQYSAEKASLGTMSIQQMAVSENALADTYGRKLADIGIKLIAAQNNVSSSCGGVQTPIIQNNPYTPTQTYCNSFGDSVSCKTYNF